MIIKKIAMDRMKEAEAREVIRWEAEQHVPFDMDNVELDFQILDPHGEGLQMTVLLVAAKRELVEHKVALLSDVGLHRASSTWTPSRCTTRSRSTIPRPCTAWSGWSTSGTRPPTSTSSTTACRCSPGTSRSAPGASRKICSASAGSPPRTPTGCCAAASRPRSLDPFLETRGEELAVGIERAAAFLQSASRSAGGISRIFTTGGGARIPRLNKVLSDRLRVPVQLANPIEKLQVADGVFDMMPVDEVAPLLMLPIGLALRNAA